MGRSTRGGKLSRDLEAEQAALDMDLDAKDFTERHKLFCLAYLRHGDAARATREAGYQCSFANAANQGWRLLQVQHIKEFIEKHRQRMAEKYAVTAESVVSGLSRLAHFHLSDVMTIDAQGRATLRLDEADWNSLAGIAEIKQVTRYERNAEGEDVPVHEMTVRGSDRVKAFELLGKTLKLFVDRTEHSGSVDIASRIADARARQRQLANEGNNAKTISGSAKRVGERARKSIN